MLSKQKLDSKIWYFLVIWGYWEFTADKLHSTLLPVVTGIRVVGLMTPLFIVQLNIPVGFPLLLL